MSDPEHLRHEICHRPASRGRQLLIIERFMKIRDLFACFWDSDRELFIQNMAMETVL